MLQIWSINTYRIPVEIWLKLIVRNTYVGFYDLCGLSYGRLLYVLNRKIFKFNSEDVQGVLNEALPLTIYL